MSLPRIAIFLAVFLGISAALHLFFWYRLIRSTQLLPPWSGLATGAVIILALLMPGGMVLQREAGSAWAVPLLWVSFVWMGLTLFLFCLLGVGELTRLGVSLGGLLSGTRNRPDSLVLSRAIAATALLGSLVLGGISMISALAPPRIHREMVHLRRWPEGLGGYTVAQLSDLHIGPTLGKRFVDGLVRRVNDLKPDLIVITGDLVDGEVPRVSPALTGLARLSAPDGVFFVTGNHDYYSGVEPWVAFVRSLGIRVLRNERTMVRGPGGFDLAGIEDWSAGRFGSGHTADLGRALSGRDTARALVLLSHQPRAVAAAVPADVDFQLSGHTHGGQLYPFSYLTRAAQPYMSGMYRVGGTMLYVSPGTGYWGPPMRLGALPEITLLTIVRGEERLDRGSGPASSDR